MFRASQTLRRHSIKFLAYSAVAFLAVGQANVLAWGQSADATPANLNIDHVHQLIGFEGEKPREAGDLSFDGDNLLFKSDKLQSTVSIKSIRGFSVVRGNVALIKGTGGKLIGFAPMGVGPAISLMRPSIDIFTFVSADDNGAVHGAVLFLPSGKGADVVKKLATVGLTPRSYPKTGEFENQPVESKREVKKELASVPGRPSIEVKLISESVDGVPDAFPVAAYEGVIANLKSSGNFENVWRQGDKRIDSDAMVLQINFKDWKEGNQRVRNVIPFTGATKLNVDVKVTDASGNVLLQKNLDAAKRFKGDNIEITTGLGQKIVEEVSAMPGLKKNQTVAKME